MSDTHIHIHLNGESVAATTSPSPKKSRAKPGKAASPPTKRKGKKNPKLSKAMKKARVAAKKKDGSFRKGWNQSKMMKHAHKLAKK